MLKIKVLGPGCKNCVDLEHLCSEVIAENGIEASIEKITDYKEIMEHGILRTPGLIINDKIISSGKIPVKATLTHWFMNALAEAE
ncbi:MAG TPA: thioredoxin family protein [Ignavibacteriaceae bacterium]|nr:thioredoxin family protein [Ignavibacteriaceae bacterium]